MYAYVLTIWYSFVFILKKLSILLFLIDDGAQGRFCKSPKASTNICLMVILNLKRQLWDIGIHILWICSSYSIEIIDILKF